MFSLKSIRVGSIQLRLFVSTSQPIEAYALVSDISTVIGIKKDSIRAEISRFELGSLIAVPDLKNWLIEEEIVPANTGKIAFATSSVWFKLLERHIKDEGETTNFRQSVHELLHPEEPEVSGNC